MSSSLFYRFRNQTTSNRITFDGTSITVFEAKRDIINQEKLGSGDDLDFLLFHEDGKTEYDDDTELIPRSQTAIAVRRPAQRGYGRAARYVSGRPPVRAIKKTTDTARPAAAGTEADAEAAFFAEESAAWATQKEALSHAKPVFTKGRKPANVPDHPPPPGYVCYRCGQKGHWIQVCPTNDDPDFKPTARAKRSTGIPQAFLKKVEKPVDGDLENMHGVMLNADGEYVQVMADTKTWEKFQEKTKATKAKASTVDAVNKEAEARGLVCSIDKRVFVDPVKMPCCGKTYCHECAENALADADLVCPNCSTDGILIDDLEADAEMVEKIRVFESEKAKEKAEREQQAQEDLKQPVNASSPSSSANQNISVPPTSDEKAKASDNRGPSATRSPTPGSVPRAQSTADSKSPLTVAAKPATGNDSDTDRSTTSKKRKEAPNDIMPPTAPKAMRLQNQQGAQQTQDSSANIEKQFIEQMEALKNGAMPNMPVPMPNMPMNPNMAMSIGMPMNPMMGAMNPMAMQGMNGWNNGYNTGYPNQGFNNQGFPNQYNQGYPNQAYQNQYNQGYPNQFNQPYANNNFGGGFQQQQQQQQNDTSAYERMPVNPHRAQKNRRQRAPDFHYV
ncbi:DWNN domain-containing protein [Lophiotrema nucula]|uniref:DWNN domain-containing protein n=1 Tax=Lophiotrema nucula TaxID=690887 RepID=A0A6A5YNV0_9PLEO|nr:DWNN domain-containing protein [Lophiotrema nucula]